MLAAYVLSSIRLDAYPRAADTNPLSQGFGNFGSLGTQIGVLSQIAPGRAGDVSRVAMSALFSGVLATLTSASIAGMLYTDSMGNGVTSSS